MKGLKLRTRKGGREQGGKLMNARERGQGYSK